MSKLLEEYVEKIDREIGEEMMDGERYFKYLLEAILAGDVTECEYEYNRLKNECIGED